ncbi:GNAT family N-acetyltransferase [Nocardioides sp. URHA0020]|uniref:GNAT family N-acetyltransferase n=1 Tax=Nocardioides sp. URHA0020 TaxID=1380392 RepID=UPI00048A8D04|nr:GNAT family N-acetyltransferase [Nocardioides sp. URHA0020]
MSALQIVEVDVFDDAALDAWHRVYEAAERACGPEVAATWQLEEVRALMQARGTRYWDGGYSGFADGRLVTVGWAQLTLLDNTERAELAVHTLPDARRRGHASAMLAHLEGVARDRGRTILVGESSWPYAAGPSGAGQPGRELARSAGYDLALGDVKRRLALPVADEVLDELAAEAAGHHAGYLLRSWIGPVPDELVDGWARLTSSLDTEAPTGELHLEPAYADVATVREGEALLVAQGRTKVNTVALDPEGQVVAYSDIATTVHEPGRAYQWGTLVRRDARGHRLGLAVKVANQRLLQREHPDVRELITYNAEVNRHMIGVNERLGFVPVARLGEFQKRVTEKGPTG